MRQRHGWIWLGIVILGLSVPLSADTLIMRDGRRVQGDLVTVREGVIEFDSQRGLFGGRDRIRVNRDDVVRIELDESRSNDRGFDRDRSPDGDRGPERDRDQVNRGSRPGGMREREVTVNGAQNWTDTGISVRAGEVIYVNATGRVRWGPGRQDGPAGERNSPRNENRPMPNRPAAALIGRVGDSNNYFFIGDATDAIRVRDSGRLYLGINDDFLQDNAGAFRVTVYY